MHPITTGLLISIGVLGLIGAFKGARRGISRQVIRSVSVVAAAILSIYLTKLFANTATVWIGNRSGEEILSALSSLKLPLEGFEDFIVNLEGETLCHVLSIPLALIVVPICFIICFLAVKLVMLLPHALISGIFGFSHRRNNFLTRLLGFVLGAVQGIAVAALIIAPAAGALAETTAIVEELNTESPDDQATVTFTNFYENYIEDIAEEPIVTAVAKFGGRDLYEKLATVKVGDAEYEMVETVKEPAISIAVGVNHLWGWDWKKPTPENEAAITEMIHSVCESEYAVFLISDMCEYVTHVYEDSEIAAGLEAPLSDLVEATIDTIAMVTEESMEDDLNTLTEAYFILARENVIYAIEFNNTDEVCDALTKDYVTEDGTKTTVVKAVVDILNDNEHTAPLVTTLAKLSVSTMADKMGGDNDMHAMYEEVRAGLSDTLSITKEGKTEEEYKTEVSASLDTVLKNNGIELEEGIVDGMSDYIYDNYDELNKVDTDGDSQLSEQEMNDIIFSYYEAYIDHMNSTEE